MSINIGLDIGSVSLKLAAIGVPADGPLFRTLTEEHATYFANQFPNSSPYADHPLVLSRYRRIQGSPMVLGQEGRSANGFATSESYRLRLSPI